MNLLVSSTNLIVKNHSVLGYFFKNGVTCKELKFDFRLSYFRLISFAYVRFVEWKVCFRSFVRKKYTKFILLNFFDNIDLPYTFSKHEIFQKQSHKNRNTKLRSRIFFKKLRSCLINLIKTIIMLYKKFIKKTWKRANLVVCIISFSDKNMSQGDLQTQNCIKNVFKVGRLI